VIDDLERPPVTFVLIAYNQEDFIAEAIEGALAQNYPALEIILSDDCSSDSTFQVIQQVVAQYDGRHVIRVNRNPKNLGIAGHINAVMVMVATEFVVVAAGDDISEPERTRALVDAWIQSGRKALSIHSCAQEIDEKGDATGRIRRGCDDSALASVERHASQNLWVLGAAHGWDMSLIRGFDPLLPSVINEDVVLPARAALLGRTQFVNRPLVRYRQGVGVSNDASTRRAEGKFDLSLPLLKRPYYSFLQKYRDYRLIGVHTSWRKEFAQARAHCLFPIWLRSGCISRVRVYFFLMRCNWRYLVWELCKFSFPSLVSTKQRIQFGAAKVLGRRSREAFRSR
jgi:glycosyltransferase involved in cell wall biosynthesis